ncbi:MAG TPA: histidinol-phosphate transaminase [Terriglobales bacterium]|nr:histidinol-phosphate transaminase [Terriglobales bacterium]
MLKPRPAIRNLKEYRPPLAGRTGLRLDFNENTQGVSTRVLEKLRTIDAEQLTRYPEREPVETLIAGFLQLEPEQLLLTNGVDEAIQLLCHTYLDTGDRALVVVPTFAMYELLAASTGAEVIPVPAGSNFCFPLESLLRSLDSRTRLIAIANPNNPTGAVAPSDQLLLLARAAPQAAILIDEAYFEFFGQTVLNEIANLPNLFVARTFSKAYGMAGLRAGILAGPATQIRLLRKAASPYNVNAIALACLPEAMRDHQFVDRYVAEVRHGRARLQNLLADLGIPYWPSQANFVLAQFGGCASQFVAAMAQHNILVRDRSCDYGCAGCVRITLGTTEQMDRVLAVMKSILNELRNRERALA